MINDDFDDVLKFVPRKNPDHTPLGVEPKRGYDPNVCKHEGSWVDNKARTVTCRKCGVLLDAFDQLYKVACRGAGLDSRIAEIRAEHERQRKMAEAKAAALLRDVPNVLARLDKGDKIEVSTIKDRSRMNGKFVKLTDEHLVLQYAGYTKEAIDRSDITAVRILKKA